MPSISAREPGGLRGCVGGGAMTTVEIAVRAARPLLSLRPGDNEPGERQQTGKVGDSRLQRARTVGREIAGGPWDLQPFLARSDDRLDFRQQHGRTARGLQESRLQRTRGAARRQEQSDIGERERVRPHAAADGKIARDQRFRERGQERAAGRHRIDAAHAILGQSWKSRPTLPAGQPTR
jgi:hypothetical protein